MVFADYIIRLNKSVLEIGTRNGDIGSCIASYVNYSAVEIDHKYCHQNKKRNLRIKCGDFEKLHVDILEGIQIVTWWIWPPTINEKWIRKLWKKHIDIVIPVDTHIPEDMRILPLLANRYGGNISRLFFDEGAIVTSENEPSYAHPNLWRPERCGILHILHLTHPRSSLPYPLDPKIVNAIYKNVRTNWNGTVMDGKQDKTCSVLKKKQK